MRVENECEYSRSTSRQGVRVEKERVEKSASRDGVRVKMERVGRSSSREGV